MGKLLKTVDYVAWWTLYREGFTRNCSSVQRAEPKGQGWRSCKGRTGGLFPSYKPGSFLLSISRLSTGYPFLVHQMQRSRCMHQMSSEYPRAYLEYPPRWKEERNHMYKPWIWRAVQCTNTPQGNPSLQVVDTITHNYDWPLRRHIGGVSLASVIQGSWPPCLTGVRIQSFWCRHWVCMSCYAQGTHIVLLPKHFHHHAMGILRRYCVGNPYLLGSNWHLSRHTQSLG